VAKRRSAHTTVGRLHNVHVEQLCAALNRVKSAGNFKNCRILAFSAIIKSIIADTMGCPSHTSKDLGLAKNFPPYPANMSEQNPRSKKQKVRSDSKRSGASTATDLATASEGVLPSIASTSAFTAGRTLAKASVGGGDLSICTSLAAVPSNGIEVNVAATLPPRMEVRVPGTTRSYFRTGTTACTQL
jgi:hypothetical protein